MLLAAGLLVAQLPSANVRDWALETPNWPDLNGMFHSDIPERGEGLSIFHTPRWQPWWNRNDSTRPQATALKAHIPLGERAGAAGSFRRA
ncbi:MAG: hypothetical protein DMG57_33770 [Acidobacteria bacterium]|nr:MAG: hypothetical protein DMG57_33770 [Acidobacteriota bacterium]